MTFQAYLIKAITVMEMQKKQLKMMSTIREKQDKSQPVLISSMMRFEEVGMEYYTDSDINKRILTHPDCEGL
jgi:hypothetical protein